jgi:hypothetical protein
MVAAVRDDPARRLELAARFYDRRTGRASIASYRRAELAFMHWQIRRGSSPRQVRTGPGARGGGPSTKASFAMPGRLTCWSAVGPER